MKKSFILSLFMLVAFGLGLSVPITAEHLKLEMPLWITIVSIVLMIVGAAGAGLSLDKDTPHKNILQTIFCMFGTMGAFYALWRGQIIPKDIAQYCNLGVLCIGVLLVFLLGKKANPADNADADETTQPLPVNDDDVTVVGDTSAEGDEAVVVEVDGESTFEMELTEGASVVVVDEDGKPVLDENGTIQAFDDEGNPVPVPKELYKRPEGTETRYAPDGTTLHK